MVQTWTELQRIPGGKQLDRNVPNHVSDWPTEKSTLTLQVPTKLVRAECLACSGGEILGLESSGFDGIPSGVILGSILG